MTALVVELPGATRRLARSMSRAQQDPDWVRGVGALLSQVRAALDEHIRDTEGPGGRYAQLVADAPRLAAEVAALTAEHVRLVAQLDQAGHDQDPAALRRSAAILIDRLNRHRQRGADLVYEAYDTDVGGET